MADMVINSDFVDGAREARAQVASGEIYDAHGALYMFQTDPADNDFQRGFEKYLQILVKGDNND